LRCPPELSLVVQRSIPSGVRFLAHRANLLASSKMLAGMFEMVPAPETEVPVIPLEESGVTLERMLAYFYPKKIPRLELGEMDKDVALIGAFDKYEVGLPQCLGSSSTDVSSLQIWRGLEAFASAFASIFQ
jgi:hypothetical protein